MRGALSLFSLKIAKIHKGAMMEILDQNGKYMALVCYFLLSSTPLAPMPKTDITNQLGGSLPRNSGLPGTHFSTVLRYPLLTNRRQHPT